MYYIKILYLSLDADAVISIQSLSLESIPLENRLLDFANKTSPSNKSISYPSPIVHSTSYSENVLVSSNVGYISDEICEWNYNLQPSQPINQNISFPSSIIAGNVDEVMSMTSKFFDFSYSIYLE